jgi:hypothetical protein
MKKKEELFVDVEVVAGYPGETRRYVLYLARTGAICPTPFPETCASFESPRSLRWLAIWLAGSARSVPQRKARTCGGTPPGR